MWWNRDDRDTVKGLAAGLAGGLAASWVMNQFIAGVKKLQQPQEEPPAPPEQQADEPGERPRHESRRWRARQREGEVRQRAEADQDATVKTAVAVSEEVLHRPLKQEEKKPAGTAVHYIFGAAMGGVYGMAAEHWDETRTGAGTLFGTALWLAADEVAVPALKLAPPPQETPLAKHATYWAAHAVYGATTELVRWSLRKWVL